MPTVVYVDVLLFINTIITYAVLITAERLFKRQTKVLRLIAAAFAGSLFSLLIFVGAKGFFFSLLIKNVSSLLITLIAFPFSGKKEFFRTTLAVIAVSAVYGGMFILIYQLFKPPNMVIVNDIVYFEFNPLVLLLCTAIIYIVISLFHKLFRERIKNSVIPLKFSVNQHEYGCIGKIDTGCNLREPFSGAPVIIVDRSVMKIDDTVPKRVIPYSAVEKNSFLYAVKADCVKLDGKTVDREIYLALTDIKNDSFQAVINSEIVR